MLSLQLSDTISSSPAEQAKSPYVAKGNLGKVKIEPMLVAGCVLWGQRIITTIIMIIIIIIN